MFGIFFDRNKIETWGFSSFDSNDLELRSLTGVSVVFTFFTVEKTTLVSLGCQSKRKFYGNVF